MNIQDVIASTEAELSHDHAAIERILDDAKARGLKELSDVDSRRTDVLFDKVEANKAKLVRARKIADDEREFDAHKNERYSLDGKRLDSGASPTGHEFRFHVTGEPHTYDRGNDPQCKGEQFLSDVARSFMGEPESQQRLAQHQREERIDRKGQMQERVAGDAVVADFTTNLIVPTYLLSEAAGYAGKGRPFANIATHKDLPATGMTLEIAQVGTPTAVANQTTELAAVAAQSIDVTPLSVPVKVASGQQTVSLSAVHRGSMSEQIVLADLKDRYDEAIDAEMLYGTTHGASTVAHVVAYVDAAPTFAAMYPYLLQAQSLVEAKLLNKGFATHAIMASRRWHWSMGSMSSSWPTINSGQPGNAAGTADPNRSFQGIRGRLPDGLDVVVDNNISLVVNSTQDEIYVVPSSEVLLYEEPNAPVYLRCEQPQAAKLGLLMVLYGFYAYTMERYPVGAMQVIRGTGCAAPAGF
jgi:hypothetical protein